MFLAETLRLYQSQRRAVDADIEPVHNIHIYIHIYRENMGKSSFKPCNLGYPASDKHSSNGLENLL